ncbi:MAG: ABC transporter ATP-binding protein [Bacteroidota bacterium]
MQNHSIPTSLPTRLWPFIAHFLRPYWAAFVVLIGASLLGGLWGPFHLWITKYVVDGSKTALPGDLSFLRWGSLLWVLNFMIFNIITWLVKTHLHRRYQPLIKNRIIEEMFAYTTRAHFGFFQQRHSGRLEKEIVTLANTVERLLETYLPELIHTLIMPSATLVTVWSVDMRLATLLIVWLTVLFVVSYKRSKNLLTLSDEHTFREAQTSGQLVDVYANIHSVRFFNNGSYEVNRLRRFLDKTRAAFQQMKGYVITLHTLQGGLLAIMLAVMSYCLILLKVTTGEFILVIGLIIRVGNTMWYTTGLLNEVTLGVGRCQQSLNSLLVPHEIIDNVAAQPIKLTQGAIQFEKVSFSYPNGEQVFDNFSLQIKPLEKIGLVGFSGTGKSTFFNLILRLFELDSGQILIDGQDIAQVTQASLRQQIAIIPQETVLFHRSILENIRYSRRDATDEEVMEAARQAGAHDFIMKMPAGYHSMVAERGAQLSGGQRQRISIARAILTNAPILILDEATSGLDCITEQKIYASLEQLMANRTTLVITHRLTLLPTMDRILVFNEDKTIESGSHQNLLQSSKYYAKMTCIGAGLEGDF